MVARPASARMRLAGARSTARKGSDIVRVSARGTTTRARGRAVGVFAETGRGSAETARGRDDFGIKRKYIPLAAVLKRQLALRARLDTAGVIQHEHVFFHESGRSFCNLAIQATRWRTTLESLRLRYRRPYVARHSSVSWNLMVGKNVLWVAKQHGHRL